MKIATVKIARCSSYICTGLIYFLAQLMHMVIYLLATNCMPSENRVRDLPPCANREVQAQSQGNRLVERNGVHIQSLILNCSH